MITTSQNIQSIPACYRAPDVRTSPHCVQSGEGLTARRGCRGRTVIVGTLQIPPGSSGVRHRRAMADAYASSTEDECVTFSSPQGLKIVAKLRDPGSKETVLLCHGLGDHKDGFCLPAMAEALAKSGFASLRLDFPGNGESEGTFRYANMRDEAKDMRAAKQFLESLGKSVVGLVGHSKAGSGVVLYAAKYNDIPRVINVSGRFDNQRGIKERFGEDIHERLEREGKVQIVWPDAGSPDVESRFTWWLTKEDMHDRMTLDMDPHSRAISKSHVLTIHGDRDSTIPVEDAFSFHERIQGGDLVVVTGADHNYNRPGMAKLLIEHVVYFLQHGEVLPSPDGVQNHPRKGK